MDERSDEHAGNRPRERFLNVQVTFTLFLRRPRKLPRTDANKKKAETSSKPLVNTYIQYNNNAQQEAEEPCLQDVT